MEELLQKLYYDPLTGFQGLDKLYRKAKLINNNITKKFTKDWLQEQETEQITKQEKKTKHIFNSIISPSVRNNFQVDIMYLPNPSSNKFKYLLTCIDVYSRKVFAEPLKTKDANAVLKGFQSVLQKSGKPNNINLDAGGEFDNLEFKRYAEGLGVTLWYSNPEQENKNAIIERFHRTLRTILLRYETARKRPYISELNNIIENYNNTYHKTIKAEPNKVWSGQEPNKQNVNYVTYDFNEGDKVRHSVKREAFNKASSTIKYTKEIYTISRAEGNSFYLRNRQGEELSKPYRGHELVLAVGEDVANEYDEQNKIEEQKAKSVRRLRRELWGGSQSVELKQTRLRPRAEKPVQQNEQVQRKKKLVNVDNLAPPTPTQSRPPLSYVRKPTFDFFKKYNL